MNPKALGEVIVEIKLNNNTAEVKFKSTNSNALLSIEKNIETLKDKLISNDVKINDFKYEKLANPNETARRDDNINTNQTQTNNQQQSKQDQQRTRREFLNTNDNQQHNNEEHIEDGFYKYVEQYV